MFFSLSGYLITGLLVKDLGTYQRIRWRRFYVHRIARLYPALLLLVATFAVVEVVWDPIGTRDHLAASIAIALTYTADLPLSHELSASISHLWSLAVEEQFYLVWPGLVLLGFTLFARQGRALYLFVLACLFTAACWITALAFAPSEIYQLPTTWVSAMAIGGAVFLVRERLLDRVQLSHAVCAAIILAALCFFPNAKDSYATYFTYPTLVAASTLTIILATERRELPKGPIRSFPLRALAALGVISYGVYLWNLPVVVWWRQATGLGGAWYAVTLPLTIVIALLSWYSVEALGRHCRRHYDNRIARRQSGGAATAERDALSDWLRPRRH